MNRKLMIPFSELHFETSRSGGAGGQNVNKVETRVRILWNPATSEALSDYQRSILLRNKLVSNRLDADGFLTLVCDSHRTQKLNKEEAIARLYEIVTAALVPPKRRVATRPTKASKRRKAEGKVHRSETKELRKKPII